jgi:hypothetical protein
MRLRFPPPAPILSALRLGANRPGCAVVLSSFTLDSAQPRGVDTPWDGNRIAQTRPVVYPCPGCRNRPSGRYEGGRRWSPSRSRYDRPRLNRGTLPKISSYDPRRRSHLRTMTWCRPPEASSGTGEVERSTRRRKKQRLGLRGPPRSRTWCLRSSRGAPGPARECLRRIQQRNGRSTMRTVTPAPRENDTAPTGAFTAISRRGACSARRVGQLL